MLESTGSLRRPTIGRDSAQGVTQNPFVTLFENVACSVQQARTSVKELYAQRNTVVTTTVYFASDPGAQVNDLFTATDRAGTVSNYLVRGKSQAVGQARLWNTDMELIEEPT